MIKEHLLQIFRILLLVWDIKVCLICTQHLAYVILHNIWVVVKVEISLKLSNKVIHETAHVRGICLMTPNNERFDWFNRIISIIYMISQQLIIQCDVCSVLFTLISNKSQDINKSQYLKNEERYGKTIKMEFLYHFKSSFK